MMEQHNMESAFPDQYKDGMTLRDYFATRVMQAMLGSNWVLKDEEIPARAYKLADLMMKAREE
jgi:hypothetical protein